MTVDKRELDELREQMGRIDAELVELAERRAKAARRIGDLRKSQPAALPLTERASVRELLAKKTGPLPEEALRNMLREVHAACLALELPVKVAYAGLDGGPSHEAARSRFGDWSNLVACESATAAIEEVARRRVEFAVVPFETSTDGPVNATFAALLSHDVKVVDVVENSVELHLMNRSGVLTAVERVYATAADRAECAKGLTEAGLRATTMDVKSPLFACQLAADDPQAAAVVSETVGAHLGLQVARRSISDRAGIRVRFAILSTRPSSRTGDDRTALAFSVTDHPGALLDVLKAFAEKGVNLTKIQSRPMQGDGWSYVFFLELVGHATDRGVITSLEEVKRLTRFCRVLGSYPTS